MDNNLIGIVYRSVSESTDQGKNIYVAHEYMTDQLAVSENVDIAVETLVGNISSLLELVRERDDIAFLRRQGPPEHVKELMEEAILNTNSYPKISKSVKNIGNLVIYDMSGWDYL